MTKIYLYTTFYNEKSDFRMQELMECISRNVRNSSIDTVTIFNEGGNLNKVASNKLKEKQISNRPTYKDFIDHINKVGDPEAIHIIANTDIYFDDNISVLKKLNFKDRCLALSRWDTTEGGKPLLYNHNDSQDVWIFKGSIKNELLADFQLGVPRCDNRFMYELQSAGYSVSNSSYSIKAFHIHKGQRALVYTEDDNIYKIPKPYRYLYPHNEYGFLKTLVFNGSNKAKLGRYRYDIKKVNKWYPVRFFRKIIESLFKKQLPLIGYH